MSEKNARQEYLFSAPTLVEEAARYVELEIRDLEDSLKSDDAYKTYRKVEKSLGTPEKDIRTQEQWGDAIRERIKKLEGTLPKVGHPLSREQEIKMMQKAISNIRAEIRSLEGHIADYDNFKNNMAPLYDVESKEDMEKKVEKLSKILEKMNAHTQQLESEL